VNASSPVSPSPFRLKSEARASGEMKLSLCQHAFTLIETTMAIGIVAFALIGVLGLMPAGMVTFQKAMDTSMSSHIVQQVVTDLQQGSFDALTQQQPFRYFDDQGNRLSGATDAALYYVNTVVQSPAALPGGPSSNLASVTVEIVKNPSHRALQRDSATQAVVATPNLAVSRFPVFISSQID